jgi:glutamate formiminotransferase
VKPKPKLSTKHSKFISCKLYISESRNAMAVDAIERASKSDAQVVVVSQFGDNHYNRFRYTLVSYIIDDRSTGEVIYSPIRKVLLAMIEAAFSTIDLESQSGAHPGLVSSMTCPSTPWVKPQWRMLLLWLSR